MTAPTLDTDPTAGVSPLAPRRFTHLCLRVADLPRAIAFYVGLLGLQHLRTDTEPDGTQTAILSHGLVLRTGGAPLPSRRTGLDHFGFWVDDAADACHFLRAQGVLIAQPVRHRRGERTFYCLDPDGNTIELQSY